MFENMADTDNTKSSEEVVVSTDGELKFYSGEPAFRRNVFTQVALAIVSSRPALVLTGSANGAAVTKEFVETVSLISEGIIKASKEFGDK